MKNSLRLLKVSLLLLISVGVKAQETQPQKEKLRFLPLPILGYSSDLGFQFGGSLEMYRRTPGSYKSSSRNGLAALGTREANDFKTHIEASYYTRGRLKLAWDLLSKKWIPGVELGASLSFTNDPLYSFYGFDGSVTPYDRELDRRNGYSAYTMTRRHFKGQVFTTGKILPGFNWMAGICYQNFKCGDLDFGSYDSETTIYRAYIDSGIITEDEAEGGNNLDLRAGVQFDNRNSELFPTRGIKADLMAIGSVLNGSQNLKMYASVCGFWSPGHSFATIAGRIAWQGIVAGSQPFYMMSNLCRPVVSSPYAEGFGGSYTVRGVLGNRILADGFGWFNLECRMSLLEWTYWGVTFDFAFNPFVDGGIITQPSRLGQITAAAIADAADGTVRLPDWAVAAREADELSKLAGRFHGSAGLGIKIGINHAFIASVEFGKAFLKEDGGVRIDMSMGYSF